MRTLVICGPSGAGKGTLIKRLLDKFANYSLAVSHTTRQPRPGEINGVHYHFVTPEAMKRAIAQGLFVEHAHVHSNMYGTSIEAVDIIHKASRVCVLDVDIKGVKQLKTNQFPAKYVFIMPPSLEVLETRLRDRGTETEEQLQTRLRNAKEEVEYGTAPDNFNQVIVNDDCDMCFDSLTDHVLAWFPESEDKMNP